MTCAVFDLDGTLLRNRKLLHTCYEAYGIGNKFEATWGRVWNVLESTPAQDAARQRANDMHREIIERYPVEFTDHQAVNTARLLVETGHRIVVATAGQRRNADWKCKVLEAQGLPTPSEVLCGVGKLDPRTWISIGLRHGEICAIFDDMPVWHGVSDKHRLWVQGA